MEIEEILRVAVNNGASDVHLRAGLPPMFRVHGSFLPLRDAPRITPEEVTRLATSVMSKIQRERFARVNEVDLSYGIKGLGRFRVCVFRQRTTVAMAIRAIPHQIKGFEDLRLPRVLEQIASQTSGLVLVTGPAGSGKTTTLAAIVDHINGHRAAHILTIDDPIEFMHRDKRCIITQREVGVDTLSYTAGLKRAVRQDPDVIVIGALDDDDLIRQAFEVAESGRLVLSTLSTASAIETVDRLIAAYPDHQQAAARRRAATVLRATIGQRLVTRSDDAERLPLVEILISHEKIREVIQHEGRLHELPDILDAGQATWGTQTYDESVFRAFSAKLLTQEQALRYCTNPDDFALRVATTDGALWTSSEDL